MDVARRLGHQDPSTTDRFYSHVEKGRSINLGDVTDKILSGQIVFSEDDIDKAMKEARRLGF